MPRWNKTSLIESFTALLMPNRREIIAWMKEFREFGAEDFMAEFGVEKATASHHLRIFKSVGFLESTEDRSDARRKVWRYIGP